MTYEFAATETNPANTITKQDRTPLFFFFWLPAGKDAFGFKDWQNAPLNIMAGSHSGVYDPIALHFKQQYEKLVQAEAFNGQFWLCPLGGTKSVPPRKYEFLNPTDATFSLRKVSCDFAYEPDLMGLKVSDVDQHDDSNSNGKAKDVDEILTQKMIEKYRPNFSGRIEGHFTMFSSGLHVWRFDIPRNDGRIPKAFARAFFRQVFFKEVLFPLFDLRWQKFDAYEDPSGHLVLGRRVKSERENQKPYNGVLNYFQLELLYNYIYGAEIVPQIFFTQTSSRGLSSVNHEIGAKRKYRLENIFSSISLISSGEKKREYYTLEEGRKSYTFRGSKAHEPESYFVPSEFLYKKSKNGIKIATIEDTESEDEDNNFEQPPADIELTYLQRKYFYGRLTLAAMEQFTRVSITFGLTPYREGIQCARKIILLTNFRAKENLEPLQLYPESRPFTTESMASTESKDASELVGSSVSIFDYILRIFKYIVGIFTARGDVATQEVETGQIDGESFDKDVGTQGGESASATFSSTQTGSSYSRPNSPGEPAPNDAIAITCTPSYAEIYYELVKNKIPGIRLLQSIILDMQALFIAGAKIKLRDENTIPSSLRDPKYRKKLYCVREFYHADQTLNGALRQLERQVTTIEGETEALRYLMERSGDREILNELVETRKIHELSAEDRIKVHIDPNQWAQLSTVLAYVGLYLGGLFAFMQIFLSVTLSLLSTDSVLYKDYYSTNPDLYWKFIYIESIVFLVAFIVGTTVILRRAWKTKSSLFNLPIGNNELSTSIYDFANLRERLDPHHTERVLSNWKHKLLPMFSGETPSERCRQYNVLSEMPTIGLEKRKYSFGSKEVNGGSSYTLHVEIEVDSVPSKEVYWTDMRFAIRTKADRRRPEDEDKIMERLVKYYVRELLKLDRDNPDHDDKLKKLLQRHFNIPRNGSTYK